MREREGCVVEKDVLTGSLSSVPTEEPQTWAPVCMAQEEPPESVTLRTDGHVGRAALSVRGLWPTQTESLPWGCWWERGLA